MLAGKSLSDLKELNATCSFPVETEQHELDPDSKGADEMVTDETPLDHDNGDDSAGQNDTVTSTKGFSSALGG